MPVKKKGIKYSKNNLKMTETAKLFIEQDKKAHTIIIKRETKFWPVRFLRDVKINHKYHKVMQSDFLAYVCFRATNNRIYVHGDIWGIIITIEQAKKILKYHENQEPFDQYELRNSKLKDITFHNLINSKI